MSAWRLSVAIASLRAKLLAICPGINNAPKIRIEISAPRTEIKQEIRFVIQELLLNCFGKKVESSIASAYILGFTRRGEEPAIAAPGSSWDRDRTRSLRLRFL